METEEVDMRFLLRITVLALAAVGAKALYDWLAPRREDLQRSGGNLVARTTTAAREVTGQATDAARRVATVARESATEVADTAAKQAQEVKAAAADARDEAADQLGATDAPDAAGDAGSTAEGKTSSSKASNARTPAPSTA